MSAAPRRPESEPIPAPRGRSPRRARPSCETLEGRFLLATTATAMGPPAPPLAEVVREALPRAIDEEAPRADAPAEAAPPRDPGAAEPEPAGSALMSPMTTFRAGEGWLVHADGPAEADRELPRWDETSPAFATVQTLPADALVEIWGELGGAKAYRLYNITLRPDTESVRVRIEREGVAGPARDWIWLMDDAGAMLGQWPMPEPGSSLNVTIPTPREGPGGLALGIAHEPAGPVAPPADSASPLIFRLTIEQDAPAAPPSPAEPTDGNSGGGGPPPGPRIDTGIRAWPATFQPTLGPGVAVARILPLRSAGPAAGVPGDGYPVPPVGLRDGVVVDLTLLGLAEGDGDDEPADPDAVVAPIHPPGGWPLLGASRPPGPDEAEPASWELARSIPEASAPETVPVASEATNAATSRTDARRRAGIGVGLVVAAAFSFGLYLPDLSVGLRPTPPKRPLPWSRRGGG